MSGIVAPTVSQDAAPAAAGASGQGGPVVLLSHAGAGADQVRDALTAGADVACTTGTGILPLCVSAAETWRRVEGQPGQAMSRLAVSTIRGMVTAQVTTILASAGKSRWCELAAAPASAVAPFLQVFPNARFVTVHRSCLDVVAARLRASPWGLLGQVPPAFLISQLGNNVAAAAADWVSSTEDLLAFERANPQVTHRVHYEDAVGGADESLAELRAALGLGAAPGGTPLGDPGAADKPALRAGEGVPASMIPAPLRDRINSAHAQLGYPELPAPE